MYAELASTMTSSKFEGCVYGRDGAAFDSADASFAQ